MQKRILKIFAVYFMLVGLISAQESHLPAAFANLNLGVRPSGMAGAYTALSNDGNALMFNPAATAFSSFAGLAATTMKIYDIVPASFLGVHYPFSKFSLVGGIQQVGDELLSETTTGIAIAMKGRELFGESMQSIPLLENMAFSMSMRMLFANFGDNEDGGEDRVKGYGQGFAIDFGWFMKYESLRFGMTVRDAIAYFRWHSSERGNYSQNSPRLIKFGIAYMKPRLRLAIDVLPAVYDDIHTRVYSGIEFNVLPWLMLRTGVAQNTGGLFYNKIWGMGFGVYNVKWQHYRLGIQAGYRTDELDQTFRFGIDLFWPPDQ